MWIDDFIFGIIIYSVLLRETGTTLDERCKYLSSSSEKERLI